MYLVALLLSIPPGGYYASVRNGTKNNLSNRFFCLLDASSRTVPWGDLEIKENLVDYNFGSALVVEPV